MYFFIFHFLEIDLNKRDISNHFHIIIEPASNLNKTKLYFSAFFLNSRHFEFQISSTQCKFLDFLQKLFSIENRFITNFPSGWGCGPCRARASADALAPHSLKKFVMKRFSMEKRCCKKSRNLP